MTARRSGIRWLVAGLVLGAVLATATLLITDDDPPTFGEGTIAPGEPDPFGWSEDRADEFEARATAGHSHVLHAKSPGGALASARRTERFRDGVEAAAEEAGVEADTVEAIVLLESAGRPEVMASDDVEGAVGLTQILAETGSNLLGMRVDVRASRRLTRRIRRAERRGETARARRLRAERRRVDERFHADKSLAATGRYLKIARERLGREDLAVVSYHMGIGNLEGVLDAYGEDDPSYTQLFFDATPDRHPRTYARLAALGDDSKTYWWRVLAAREIMRLSREDPDELERQSELYTAKNSAEEMLHPPDETEAFESAQEIEEAFAAGTLRPFPDQPARYGLRRDPQMGELADDPRLYRGLRPEAFALAVYIATRVREISGSRAPLTVTSTVRDGDYQRLLLDETSEATPNYSLHTTGWAFDVRRRYSGRAQAAAFQAVLDRLQSLNVIAWVREPGAIHITASEDAAALLPLLE